MFVVYKLKRPFTVSKRRAAGTNRSELRNPRVALFVIFFIVVNSCVSSLFVVIEIDASECFFFLFGEGGPAILFPLIGGMSRIKMEMGGRFERGVTTFKSLASAFSSRRARTRVFPTIKCWGGSCIKKTNNNFYDFLIALRRLRTERRSD